MSSYPSTLAQVFFVQPHSDLRLYFDRFGFSTNAFVDIKSLPQPLVIWIVP